MKRVPILRRSLLRLLLLRDVFFSSDPAQSKGPSEEGIEVDRGQGSQGRPQPVNGSKLQVGVALAAKLETSGQHRIVVAAGVIKGWKVKEK